MKYILTIAIITLMTTTTYASNQLLRCEARRGTTVINLTTGQTNISLICWVLGCQGDGQLESIKINSDGSRTYFLSMNLYGLSQQETVLLNVQPNGDSIISIQNLPMKCQMVVEE